MNSISFGKEVYGIRFGKKINGHLQILYEQNNLYNLEHLKKVIEYEVDNKIHYFVCKEQINVVNGYTHNSYTWLECEKDYILSNLT